jgi:anti-anti-sigma factor
LIPIATFTAPTPHRTFTATVITSSIAEPVARFSAVEPPVGRLSLTTEELNPEAVRIAVAGDLDASNHDQFAAYVLGRTAECRRLVLDLRGLEFFSTAGINAISVIDGWCVQAGIEWTLQANQMVTRVLEICGEHPGAAVAAV